MSLETLMLTVFLLNLPFGHMRSKYPVYSRNWMLAIHIPVPFIIILRRLCDLGWNTVPLLIAADVAGQLVGGKISKLLRE